MISLKNIKAQILKDPEASAEYAEQQPEFAIARGFIFERMRSDMTQAELAQP